MDVRMSEIMESGPGEDTLEDVVVARASGMAGPSAKLEDYRYRVSRRIVCVSDPNGAAAETIRNLRAHLLATHIRQGRRSLAICGPAPGVGCSYVAVNLAVALAQTGLNTLLIDANLNNPGVDAYIKPEESAEGLRQMLTGDTVDRPVPIRRDVLPNLSVLYAGGAALNAAELIAKREFKTVLDECLRNFEITIVDTTISGGSADLRRIAMNTRYSLIVARRNVSMISQVRSLAHELASDNVSVIGTFLTDF
jgi:Mrp family chromosome partitioning ATPase